MTSSRPKDREQEALALLKRRQECLRNKKASGKKPQPIFEPEGSMAKRASGSSTRVLSQDKLVVGSKLLEFLEQELPTKPKPR